MKTEELHSRTNGSLKKHTLRPLLDFMLLEMEKRETALVMLDNKPDNADVFTVVAIGPGYFQDGTFIDPQVKQGDKVFIVGNLFELKHKGVQYKLARSREVIAVVN